MVATPGVVPLTMPDASTLATAALLLLHVPPADVHARVMVLPTHTLVVPLMAAGADDTVATTVRLQPVLKV